MVTPPDVEAQILRYYHAEKWRIGTIAAQLHVHHAVVTRVLAQAGLPRHGRPPRPSKVDAYLPFIRQTLENFLTVDSQPAARNGARARLPRSHFTFSPSRCLPPSASSGRGVSAAAQPAG